MEEHSFKVDSNAVVEVVSFEGKSWIRWYVEGDGGPSDTFKSNGNIDLPPGEYRLKEKLGNTVSVVKVEKEYKEYFGMANDINFANACDLFWQNNKRPKNPMGTIADRIGLIQHLENWGFEIVKKS